MATTFNTASGGETVNLTADQQAKLSQANPNLASSFSPVAGGVNVQALENPSNINMPQAPQVDMGPVSASVKATQGFVDQAQAALAQPQEQASQSEQQIRQLMGLMGTQEATKQGLEEQAGIPQNTKVLQDLIARIQNASAQMADFDDQSFFGIEQMRQDLDSSGAPSAIFNAQARAAELQRAISRRGEAAQLRAMTASAQLLQNNLSAAQDQVERAVRMKFEPVKAALETEMFFLSRLDKTLDAKQKELAEAKKFKMQAEIQSIQDAEGALSSAVQMGYATPDDIERIMKHDNPVEMLQDARSVYATGAKRDLDLQRELQRAQLAKLYSDMMPKSPVDKPLSISELEALNSKGHNLPYGITHGQLAQMGIAPGVGSGEPSEFARMVIDNPALIADLTPTERGNVYKEIAASGGQIQTKAQESALNISRNALTQVNELLDLDRGRRSASGLRGLTYYLPGSAGRQFDVKLETLKSQLTLPNLEFLAGLGRMSQEQFREVKNASQNLEARQLSNTEMKRQLEIVKNNLESFVADAEKRGTSSLPSNVSDNDYQQYLRSIGL